MYVLLQVYLSALAFAIVLVRSRWGNLITLHLETLLFVAWAVFLYRDVWPLATYTLSPQDLNDGWIIWAEISLLTVAAILIPGLTPRQYVPVDFEV